MPRINILSPHVADLIAAGEVVERPASAVKELMENAIDAGAKNITVEFTCGGTELIRITDDGCGMSPEDAGVAFLRHATSKLADERGLEAIGTLGFRGEALAAISSVSRIELITRERGAAEGTYMTLEAGDIEEMRPTGASEGTSISVRALFFNTPARRKFLKSDKAEGAACLQAALRCALGRPDVSIRCIRDGKEEFFTPGDGKIESAVYALLGRETALKMLPVDASSTDADLTVIGFTSAPEAARGSRTGQYFYCNGRAIKSQFLQAAVEQAYRGRLLVGRFPACVLYLNINPSRVDVNVHPAKTEVKFTDEREVFSSVYHAVLGALTYTERDSEPPKEEHVPAQPRRYVPYGETASEPRGAARPARWNPGESRADAPEARDVLEMHAPRQFAQTSFDLSPAAFGGKAIAQPRAVEKTQPVAYAQPAAGSQPAADTQPAESTQPVIPSPFEAPKAPEVLPGPECGAEPVRVIGEALGVYILAQMGDKLYVIDKHAAHERMLYDALMERDAPVHSQALLEAVTMTPSPECAESLESNAEALTLLGFEYEPFGKGAYILRSAPATLEPDEAAAALEEAALALAGSRTPDIANARGELLKTVACKAAIKAGPSSEPAELQKLAEAVCSGRVRYCPHGRPVSWVLTRKDLDKQFKRIV